VRVADSSSAARGAGAADPTSVPRPGRAPRQRVDEPASNPIVGVLALQGAVREHLASLAHLGLRGVEVRNADDLGRVDGLIIPGGESTAISMLIESSGLREPLQKRLDAGMPAFGTCAGMILLANEVADGRPDQHFFGAIDIKVRRNAFGRQVDSFETDLALGGNGSEGDGAPLHAVFIRAPVVERVGSGVEVLSTVDGFDGGPRPVVCRQGPVLVAAFHPELTADTRLHQLFVSAVMDAKGGATGLTEIEGAGLRQDDGAGEAEAAGEFRRSGLDQARGSMRKEG
jgi:pyridoxal 5'-phosphate synthase pdxT subunit